MPWSQFLAWRQYAAVEPFGEERADLRAGIVASVIANVNRDPSKGEPLSAQDFMPKFETLPEPLRAIDFGTIKQRAIEEAYKAGQREVSEEG